MKENIKLDFETRIVKPRKWKLRWISIKGTNQYVLIRKEIFLQSK